MSFNRYREVGTIVGLVEDEGKTYAAINFAGCAIEPVTVETDVLSSAGIEPVEPGLVLSAEITAFVDEEFYVAPAAFRLPQVELGDISGPAGL